MAKQIDIMPDGTEIEIVGPPGKVVGLLPIGFPGWWLGTTPPDGWLDMSINLGQLHRGAYSQLFAFAESSGNILSEADWLSAFATNGSVDSFSYGDGSTTFRIPLQRRTYVRASDPDTGLAVGQYQEDAQQNITGKVVGIRGSAAQNYGDGVFYYDTVTGAYTVSVIAGGTDVNIRMDAARQIRTAEEVRVKTVVRMPIIHAFDSVRNEALVEISGLITQLGMTNDRIEVSQQVLHVQDQKISGTPGGTLTADTWHERDLNTILINTIPNASLSNNKILLPAGTYQIEASAPAYGVNNNKALFMSTDVSFTLFGTSEYSNATSPSTTKSSISTVITLTESKTFSLWLRGSSTNATTGLGVACTFGSNEKYSNVFIRRIN